jgi:hypothetical protein
MDPNQFQTRRKHKAAGLAASAAAPAAPACLGTPRLTHPPSAQAMPLAICHCRRGLVALPPAPLPPLSSPPPPCTGGPRSPLRARALLPSVPCGQPVLLLPQQRAPPGAAAAPARTPRGGRRDAAPAPFCSYRFAPCATAPSNPGCPPGARPPPDALDARLAARPRHGAPNLPARRRPPRLWLQAPGSATSAPRHCCSDPRRPPFAAFKVPREAHSGPPRQAPAPRPALHARA